VTGLGELLSLWDLGALVCVMRAGVQEHISPRLSAWPQQVHRGECWAHHAPSHLKGRIPPSSITAVTLPDVGSRRESLAVDGMTRRDLTRRGVPARKPGCGRDDPGTPPAAPASCLAPHGPVQGFLKLPGSSGGRVGWLGSDGLCVDEETEVPGRKWFPGHCNSRGRPGQ